MKMFIVFIMLLVSVFVITGNVLCAGGQIQWSSAVGETNKPVPPPYSPAGKINPFRPIISSEQNKPAPAVHKTDCVSNPVLERLDMSQLKLSGVVLTEGQPIALFQEANGKGHVITEGVCFGARGGMIERILNGRVQHPWNRKTDRSKPETNTVLGEKRLHPQNRQERMR